MPQKLDGKFYGVLFREKDHTPVPPDRYVVFLARDKAFLPTLRYYRRECEHLGAADPQLAAVDNLIARVEAWQKAHPDEMKLPDVDPGELSWEN